MSVLFTKDFTGTCFKCWATVRHWTNAVWIAFVLIAVVGIACNSIVTAQTADSDSSGGFLTGMVTNLRGNTVEIDDKSYELASNVVIKSEEGKTMEPSDIVLSAAVKFYLKQGRINKMVLTLPR